MPKAPSATAVATAPAPKKEGIPKKPTAAKPKTTKAAPVAAVKKTPPKAEKPKVDKPEKAKVEKAEKPKVTPKPEKVNGPKKIEEVAKAVCQLLAKNGRMERKAVQAEIFYSSYTNLGKYLESEGLALQVKHESDKYVHLELTAKGKKIAE